MTQWGLDTLFNPAKRHMDEEKRRLQSTREQIGDASGGKRIDLESGKVRIRRDEADTDEAPGGPAQGEAVAGDTAPGEDGGTPAAGESDARARARARQARIRRKNDAASD